MIKLSRTGDSNSFNIVFSFYRQKRLFHPVDLQRDSASKREHTATFQEKQKRKGHSVCAHPIKWFDGKTTKKLKLATQLLKTSTLIEICLWKQGFNQMEKNEESLRQKQLHFISWQLARLAFATRCTSRTPCHIWRSQNKRNTLGQAWTHLLKISF